MCATLIKAYATIARQHLIGSPTAISLSCCLLNKPILFFPLLVIFFFSSACLGLDQMMPGVGVGSGDVFSYGYTCYFGTNDPNAVPPIAFSWINQTEYFLVNVTQVSGSVVSFDTTLHLLNGSIIAGRGSMDVGNGMSSMSGYSPMGTYGYYFMSSNVGMMGRMFLSSSIGPTVNGTLMMNYSGGQRSTDYLSLVVNQNGMMNESDFYFDQSTGAMVEWHQQTVQTSSNFLTNSTQVLNLTSSSVWAVPEFPIFIISLVLIAVTVVLIAVVVAVRIRKNRTKTGHPVRSRSP